LQLRTKKIKQTLSKSYQKRSITAQNYDQFNSALQVLSQKLKISSKKKQNEENNKANLRDFLLEAFYKKSNAVENKSYKGRFGSDLVICADQSSDSKVQVLFEVKSPLNTLEFISEDKLNSKALQEIVLYYLWERIKEENNEIKHLVITNLEEWFIFNAQEFHRIFYESSLKKDFLKWSKGKLDSSKTNEFHQIVSKFVEQSELKITCTSFKVSEESESLIKLYKILSPEFLLKQGFENDSNTLNRAFYSELLHIIGLEEKEEKGKKLIKRKIKPDRGSILENLIVNIEAYKDREYSQKDLFDNSLQLSITWINRILFLKLLEAQLFNYHQRDNQFKFLNQDKIESWDDLSCLFFKVLAKKTEERKNIPEKFSFIPYLNSSLFEQTDLEKELGLITLLNDASEISVYPKTALKIEDHQKKLRTIDYLINFLNAYDFGAEDQGEIQLESKTIINASVLGLIFEKINGYQDGSFFTPGYITMYMCRQTIRKAVINKFNQKYKWDCQTIEELENQIDRKKVNLREANELVESLKICDPAVGSGHFLVSALNEIISVKSDLNILIDSKGKRLNCYTTVDNDELSITDRFEEIFQYKVKLRNSGERSVAEEINRIQESIFHEKQKIIENCLFGVDLNPNSVKICRLRLWIELLKNAYYKSPKSSPFQGGWGVLELQTLPNIDINIKQGNSLVSRYAVWQRLTIDKISEVIKDYLEAVQTYKNSTNKVSKDWINQKIAQIKEQLGENLFQKSDLVIKKNNVEKARNKVLNDLETIKNKADLGKEAQKNYEKKKIQLSKESERLNTELQKLEIQLDELKTGELYKKGFEWRFEFPEVLDQEGNFRGFDVVIGNPPYVRQEEIKELKPYLKENYAVFNSIADIYTYFIELSHSLLSPDGYFSFIISNKFTRANYGKSVRSFLIQGTEIEEFIDFSGLSVFDQATVDAAILSYKKSKEQTKALLNSKNKQTNQLSLFKKTTPENSPFQGGWGVKTLEYASIEKEFLQAEKPDLNKYLTDDKKIKFSLNLLSQDSWTFSSEQELAIKQKVEAKGVPLKDWDIEINYGIKTGLNEAFIIDKATKDKLIKEDPKSAEILKPLLRGRDIKKWKAEFADLWLINVHNGYLEENPLTPLKGGTQDSEARDVLADNLGKFGNFTYSQEIGEQAKLMRANPTKAEKHLWDNALRSSQLGFKFTRQKPIHQFILDFYCSELLLGIEADGEVHAGQKEQDQLRTEYLNSLNIEIIRFKNEEILTDLENIKKRIIEYIEKRKEKLSRTKTQAPPFKGAGGFPETKIPPININNYPAIKRHLDQFHPKLENRADQGKTPYNLRNCAYLHDFEKPKIVWKEMVQTASFLYDENGFLGNDTTSFISGSSRTKLKSLTALLNSRFIDFIYRKFYSGGGLGASGYRYKKDFMRFLPIKKLSEEEQKPFVELVDQIMELKNPLAPLKGGTLSESAQAEVSYLENQIDQLVYKLYDLTEEEIQLIEGL